MTYTWVSDIKSRIISNTPACVGAILFTPKETKKTTLTLYDGSSASDPEIMNVRSTTGETKVIHFQPYLVTHRGLYITVDGDIEYFMVQLGIQKE